MTVTGFFLPIEGILAMIFHYQMRNKYRFFTMVPYKLNLNSGNL